MNRCAEERGLLAVRFIDSYIGHGVFAKERLPKHEFICEYIGECISEEEGERRFNTHNETSFLFFFNYKGKKLCIDSTDGFGCGRMMNDSSSPNCLVKVLPPESADGYPRLGIFAKKLIQGGSELRFNYGVSSVSWRKKNAERTSVFTEPDFFNATPAVVVVGKDGSDVSQFPLLNGFCSVGSSRDCNIVVSRKGVESVACLLEVHMGEVFLTESNKLERRLNLGDKFKVGGRDFRVDKYIQETSKTQLSELCSDVVSHLPSSNADETENTKPSSMSCHSRSDLDPFCDEIPASLVDETSKTQHSEFCSDVVSHLPSSKADETENTKPSSESCHSRSDLDPFWDEIPASLVDETSKTQQSEFCSDVVSYLPSSNADETENTKPSSESCHSRSILDPFCDEIPASLVDETSKTQQSELCSDVVSHLPSSKADETENTKPSSESCHSRSILDPFCDEIPASLVDETSKTQQSEFCSDVVSYLPSSNADETENTKPSSESCHSRSILDPFCDEIPASLVDETSKTQQSELCSDVVSHLPSSKADETENTKPSSESCHSRSDLDPFCDEIPASLVDETSKTQQSEFCSDVVSYLPSSNADETENTKPSSESCHSRSILDPFCDEIPASLVDETSKTQQSEFCSDVVSYLPSSNADETENTKPSSESCHSRSILDPFCDEIPASLVDETSKTQQSELCSDVVSHLPSSKADETENTKPSSESCHSRSDLDPFCDEIPASLVDETSKTQQSEFCSDVVSYLPSSNADETENTKPSSESCHSRSDLDPFCDEIPASLVDETSKTQQSEFCSDVVSYLPSSNADETENTKPSSESCHSRSILDPFCDEIPASIVDETSKTQQSEFCSDVVSHLPSSNADETENTKPSSMSCHSRSDLDPFCDEIPASLVDETSKTQQSDVCSDVVSHLPSSNADTTASIQTLEPQSDELYFAAPVNGESTKQYVSRAGKNVNGKFKLDKRQICFFCQKSVLKIGRHLQDCHKNERDVQKIAALKERKNKDYLIELDKLKCLGNFNHNIKILSENQPASHLIVAKRPTKFRQAKDFTPCPHCYGFYVLEELWRHILRCKVYLHLPESKNDKNNRMSVIASSRLILEGAVLQAKGIGNRFADLKSKVLAKARMDYVYNTMVTDELIMAFGSILLRKLGPGRTNDITQRMRQLTRLVIVLNERSGKGPVDLSTYISSDHFDDVISATEELCGLYISKDGRRAFQSPSLALRLGHLLNKVTDVKLGVSMRTKDTVSKTESEDFRSLMKAEWTDTISSNALNTLKRKKDQDILLLPVTEDLTKMKDFLISKIKHLCVEVQNNPNYYSWRKLAQFIMTRLILFNKRRGGEVSRLLLETYLKKPNWGDSANQELISSLKPLEKQLVKRMDLLQIPGKKDRKVPLLLTEEVKNGMEMLVNKRSQCNIPSENPYFFASRSSGGYLESCQSMSLAANSAELKNPNLVTSTRLRKYNATVCQVVDLSPVETEWLSNHMGHSLNIHKNFYRLHDSVIELAKVSRVLLAVDNGQIAKYQGKRLEDINMNDLNVDEVVKGESDDEVGADVDDAICNTELADSQQDDFGPNRKRRKTKRSSHTGSTASPLDRMSEHEAEATSYSGPNSPMTKIPDMETDDDDCVQFVRRKRRRVTVLESSSDEGGCSNDGYDKTNHLQSKNTRKFKVLDGSSNGKVCSTFKQARNVKKSDGRSTWTAEEVSVLYQHFSLFIQRQQYPSSAAIQKLINRGIISTGRTVLMVKAKLQHLMKMSKV